MNLPTPGTLEGERREGVVRLLLLLLCSYLGAAAGVLLATNGQAAWVGVSPGVLLLVGVAIVTPYASAVALASIAFALLFYRWRRLPRWTCVAIGVGFGWAVFLVQRMWETK